MLNRGLALAAALAVLASTVPLASAAPADPRIATPETEVFTPFGDHLRPYGDIDFSKYHAYPVTVQQLKDKATKYPQIAKLHSLGKSWEGQDMWALKVSDNVDQEERDEPEIYINAMHHAREWLTTPTALYAMDFLTSSYATDPRAKNIVDSRQIWFVPVVNPDGRVRDGTDDATAFYKACGSAGWRKNTRDNNNNGQFDCNDGVDMNRNYLYDFGGGSSSGNMGDETYRGPAAFSEPETRSIRDSLLDRHWFRSSITLHTSGMQRMYVSNTGMDSATVPYFTKFGSLITNNVGSSQNGYSDSKGGGSSGQEHGTEFNVYKTMSMLVELYPSGSDSQPSGYNNFHPPPTKIQPLGQDLLEPLLWSFEVADNTYKEANYNNDVGVWGIFPYWRAGGIYPGGMQTIEVAVENFGSTAAQPDLMIDIYRDPKGANTKIHTETKKTSAPLAQSKWEYVLFNYDISQNDTYRLVATTTGGTDQQAWNNAKEVTFNISAGGNLPPRVVTTAPVDGAGGVPTNAQLSVTFSKAMDQASVQAAFATSPSIAGSFTWSAPTQALFTPSAPLAASTMYTPSVDVTAKDTGGLNMAAKHSWSFTTETLQEAPKVTTTAPADGANAVPVATTIAATFSKDMDATSVQAAFSVSPAVAGSFSWQGRSLTYTPSAPLQVATKYAVTIAKSAQDTGGLGMTADHGFSFTTETPLIPPKITDSSPQNSPKDWAWRKGTISVTFSEGMDKTATEGAFSLAPTASGTATWDAGATKLTFVPSALTKGAMYEVKVAKSAKNAVGTEMAADYTFSFEAGVPPEVLSSSVSEGATSVPVAAEFTIDFSEPMDHASVGPAVKLDPFVPLSQVWGADSKVLTLKPTRELDPTTQYKLTLSTSAADVPGNDLEQEWAVQFTTAGGTAPPFLSQQIFGFPTILFLAVVLAAVLAVAVAAILMRRRKRPTQTTQAMSGFTG